MEPTLLVGDRIFVSKYSYGYSKHSFPFSPPIFSGRIFYSKPNYGDLVVFKTPSDNRTDFIKRLIGFPGDEVQFKNGELIINNKIIPKKKTIFRSDIRCANNDMEVTEFIEENINQKSYKIVYKNQGSWINTDLYKVPQNHYFFLGDNRDCSSDSRVLINVGYVHENNLVGKARLIFFSNNTKDGSVLKFWNWNKSFRTDRFFKTIE